MKSFKAEIYVGFKEFTNPEHTEYILHTLEECEQICQDYCDLVGLCVTVTPTKYIYKNGNEQGVIIGLIQYPRFPCLELEIENHALFIGRTLLEKFGQYRITINLPNEVVMLTNDSKLQDYEKS